MLQVRRRLDLSQEPFGPDHCGQFRLEHLERDLPLVLQIVGEIHRGHAALTELALDLVATLEGRVQAGDGIRVVHLPKMLVRAVIREKVPLHGGERRIMASKAGSILSLALDHPPRRGFAPALRFQGVWDGISPDRTSFFCMTVADTYGAKLWLTLNIRWRTLADLPVQQRETAACVGQYEGTADF